MKKGVWKEERATGRKYSKSDVHKRPKAHTQKKIWVSDYKKKGGKKVKGYFKKNPNFRRNKQ